jgi:hypothetical protein
LNYIRESGVFDKLIDLFIKKILIHRKTLSFNILKTIIEIFDSLTRNHIRNSIYFLQFYRNYDLSSNESSNALLIDTLIKCQK